MKRQSPIAELLKVMARLRSPDGCPWDREQDHLSLRFHAVEEVYELMDAIEAGDDLEMLEELGDLLLQVVFHCQLASERGAFDFEEVCRVLVDKLVRRHPHVFGDIEVKDVDEVWANWERIKKAEKRGTRRERPSAFDGIPKHLPALLRAEKLLKKAAKAGLLGNGRLDPDRRGKSKGRRDTRRTRTQCAEELFQLAAYARKKGWSAEDLLRAEVRKRERAWRRKEKQALPH